MAREPFLTSGLLNSYGWPRASVMLRKCERFFYLFGLVEMWLSAVLILGIAAIILLQVFCRYVLGSPLIWPEELSILFIVWMTFIGASYVYKKNRHLTLSFFVERMSKPWRSAIELLNHGLNLIFFYYVFQGGMKIISIQARNLTPALRIPTHYYTLPVLLTAGLISLYIIYYIFKRALKLVYREESY